MGLELILPAFTVAKAAPPAPTQLVQFEHTPAGSNGMGFGTPVSSDARFTHGGTTYIFTMIFTHGNGVQMRFQTNAQALAFIAADFLVDLGIPGVAAFRTSLMDNINPSEQRAAQYRAYTGRFVTNTTYTITISE